MSNETNHHQPDGAETMAKTETETTINLLTNSIRKVTLAEAKVVISTDDGPRNFLAASASWLQARSSWTSLASSTRSELCDKLIHRCFAILDANS